MGALPHPAEGKIIKKNPWAGTGYESGAVVLQDPPVNSNRREGLSAAAPEVQRKAEELSSSASEVARSCDGESGKANMACRAREMSQRLSER